MQADTVGQPLLDLINVEGVNRIHSALKRAVIPFHYWVLIDTNMKVDMCSEMAKLKLKCHPDLACYLFQQ